MFLIKKSKLKEERSTSLFRSMLYNFLSAMRNALRVLKGGGKLVYCYLTKANYDRIFFVVSKELKVAYLVNSKVACSTVKAELIKREVGLDNFKSYGDVHLAAKKYKMEVSKKEMQKEKYKGYYKFTIVRNPVSRIVSCYNNKMLNHEGIRSNGFEFSGYLGGVIGYDYSFLEFVNIVVSIPDYLSDRHFRSQSYLVKNCGVVLDDVYNIEDVDCNKLESKGIKLSSNFNKTKVNKDNEGPFDSEVLEMIKSRYKSDIEEFGYENY